MPRTVHRLNFLPAGQVRIRRWTKKPIPSGFAQLSDTSRIYDCLSRGKWR